MFLAGLPCWLIWESETFGDEKIFMIAEVLYPKDYIILDPHKFNYPIIFKGPASGLKKFNVVEKFAHNFLCSQDPFAITSTPLSLAGASQPSTSSTPAVASSSATQHSAGQNSQEAIHRSVRGHGAGKFSAFNIYQYYWIVTTGSHQSSCNHGHNIFQSIMDLPIAPLSIPSWSSALAVVDDDPSHVDECYCSANDCKYVFPKPGIFLGTNAVWQAKYLLTWKALEPACIHQLLSSTAPPLSSQEWRDILIGSLEFKSLDSTCVKAHQHACHLLVSATDDLNLNIMNPATPSSPPVDSLEVQVMLWCLSELNFRFELLACVIIFYPDIVIAPSYIKFGEVLGSFQLINKFRV